MNQAFYAAAVAASQQQLRMNVVANNLSNVNTTGFKAEDSQFEKLMYQQIADINGETIIRGTGSRMVQTTTDFEQGGLVSTGVSQHYAIVGDGFFAVQDPETDTVCYTRAGAFHWGSVMGDTGETEFYLCDPEGYYVLDQNGQPITMTGDSEEQYPVGVFDFANTNDMQHLGNSKFAPVEKNGMPLQADCEVVFGSLELSNTDVATEFVKMVESQRSFSYALKMVQTQDQITETINGLRN